MLISIPALLLESPDDWPTASVTAGKRAPKTLERKRLPRSAIVEPGAPATKAPGLEIMLESAPDVFAGFVIMPKNCPIKPGSSTLAATPDKIAADPPSRPRRTASGDSPSCEAIGPETFGPSKLITLSTIEPAIRSS